MSRIKRDPRSSGNALPILGLIVGLIMLALNLIMQAEAAELEVYTSHSWQEEYAARRPGMTYWPDNIVLEYPADMKAEAELAAWRWSQRIGKTITTRLATNEGKSTSGVITIVWKTPLQIFQITGNIFSIAATQRWSWSDTGYIAGAVIYMPIGGRCINHTLLHEVGHAIGIHGHDGTSPEDVMSANQSNCLPALSVQDVSMAPYTDHPCHSELMPDGSLYIPAVEGWAVHLSASMEILRASPLSKVCAEARLIGDDLFLSDIRSPSGRWMGQLRLVEGQWQVMWVESR